MDEQAPSAAAVVTTIAMAMKIRRAGERIALLKGRSPLLLLRNTETGSRHSTSLLFFRFSDS
jgi:hypothetical protein